MAGAGSLSTYRLLTDESVGDGVKRIVEELASEAQAHLRTDDPAEIPEAIHETRKLCKKARGLARLVRPALGEDYTPTNRLFRDAARELGPIRDPHAISGTFEDLAAVPGLLGETVANKTGDQLAERAEEATMRILENERDRISRASELIEEARSQSVDWNIPDEFEPIGCGVAKTYKRGRKRFTEASRTRESDVFHEWRKRVKYLWYQTRLLRNSAPSILRPLANRLHDLSDALGDSHDLVVLGSVIDELDLDDEELAAVDTASVGMRAKLEDRALSLASRLYAEEPGVFVDRLSLYWDAWQVGEELEAGEIEYLFPPNHA